MDWGIDKECSALGGLFQHIASDLKNGHVIWEDFLSKATKLHYQLKQTVQVLTVFLDAMQKVADLATNAKGATRDIGTALTRICMRHRSIENRLKTLTSSIIECMVNPLQGKADEWRKTAVQLDKEHAREYKKARAEIKKKGSETARLQKKAKRGGSISTQRMMECAVKETNEKYLKHLSAERGAVKQVLLDQRAQFCLFVSCFKPVMDGEVALLHELSQLEDVLEVLYRHAEDPSILPPSSEAVITDIKGLENAWHYQTPPSSPSSLGSRKSSYCSLSSCSDAGSQIHQQSNVGHLLKAQSSVPPLSPKYSSVGSADSGFTSQDKLHSRHTAASPPPPKLTTNKEECLLSDDDTNTPCSQQTTPSPSLSSATWPDDDPTGSLPWQNSSHEGSNGEPAARPHTISAAYEIKSGRRIPIRDVNFAPLPPPRPTSLLKESQIEHSDENELGGGMRWLVPSPTKKAGLPWTRQLTPISSSECAIPDFSQPPADQVLPQPIYMNMNELQRMQRQLKELTEKPIERQRRPLSFVGTEALNNLILERQETDVPIDAAPPNDNTPREEDEATLIEECMDELAELSTDLERYCSQSSLNSFATSATAPVFPSSTYSISTLPRSKSTDESETVYTATGTIVRRHSVSNNKPLPPTRRNSSITSATANAPAVDKVRSRCTTPVQDTYGSIVQSLNMRFSMNPSLQQYCGAGLNTTRGRRLECVRTGTVLYSAPDQQHQRGGSVPPGPVGSRGGVTTPLSPYGPPLVERQMTHPQASTGVGKGPALISTLESRQALMMEIRSNNKLNLKRVCTNDKSRPRI